MVNLIYKSFPFGTAEMFASYEMPYAERIFKGELRVFSFYTGETPKTTVSADININATIIQLKKKHFLRALISCFSKEFILEIMRITDRKCKDSIIRCFWRILYYKAYGFALYDNVKRSDDPTKDVFIAYWMNECAYAAVMLKKWYPLIRVYSRGHGFDVYEERCYLPFRETLLNGLDGIYLVNKIEKDYLLSRHPNLALDGKIHVSHLGISIPETYSTESKRKPLSIVSCSSVIQLKRLDLLVEALSRIHDFDFVWTHIGGGVLLSEIVTLATKKLIYRNQKYHFTGQLSLDEVHSIYRTNDISLFINCSDTEGVPVSIMEAMSYGIPVIARDVGGNGEIVNDQCGVLLSGTDIPEELFQAITYIYQIDDEKYTSLRRNAREKVMREFNAQKQYSRFFNEVTYTKSKER